MDAVQHRVSDLNFLEVLSLKYEITFDSLGLIINPVLAAEINQLGIGYSSVSNLEG
jgi:hypothetical protein